MGQVVNFCPLLAFEAQFHRQLVAGGVAQVLAIQPALQVRVMATVFALDHLLGGVDGVVVETGLGQQRQQQVEYLALVFRRGLDHERGVGIAGVGVPFTTQRLHALFEATFTAGVDAAEQQVFKQVWQFLIGAAEVIQADAHHQPNRHMTAFHAGFEQQLQTVAQGITLDLEAIQGK